jgi:hypothetical protein
MADALWRSTYRTYCQLLQLSMYHLIPILLSSGRTAASPEDSTLVTVMLLFRYAVLSELVSVEHFAGFFTSCGPS